MGAEILYVGHSTVLVSLDGVRLLTDPLLRPRLAHLRRLARVPPDVAAAIDAALVSHLHPDHLDARSLARLRGATVVVPRGAHRLVRRLRHVVELEPGETTAIGPLEVLATLAVHDAARLPLGRLAARPLGYVVRGSRSVYFAGDTDLFPAMAELAPVDVALVPVSGWGRTLGPGHLDPERAAQALRLLRPRLAIPIHWGTYVPLYRVRRPAADTPAEQFAQHARRIAPEVEVRVLRPGERTAI